MMDNRALGEIEWVKRFPAGWKRGKFHGKQARPESDDHEQRTTLALGDW